MTAELKAQFHVDMRCYAAEFVGTAVLVYFAAGSVMVSAVLGSLPGPLVSGVASGCVLTVMVWALFDISGAHFNPALSITLWLFGEFPARRLPGYIAAQLAGSTAAAGVLFATLGHVGGMGANMPNAALGVGPAGAFAAETMLSLVMMIVIRGAFASGEPLRQFAAVPIGAVVGIEVMLMGSVAGAAMNPARAFGPTLFLGDWSSFWIYAAGPIAGLVAGAGLWRLLTGHSSASTASTIEHRDYYATSARRPADWPT